MLIYLAHPVSGDPEGNVEKAKKWIRWLADEFPEVTVIAPWIVDCQVMPDADPKYQGLGLLRDREVVPRCDGLIAVGERISFGVGLEIGWAEDAGRLTLDLTCDNYKRPDRPPADGEIDDYELVVEALTNFFDNVRHAMNGGSE